MGGAGEGLAIDPGGDDPAEEGAVGGDLGQGRGEA
jgi:hypothetical protein